MQNGIRVVKPVTSARAIAAALDSLDALPADDPRLTVSVHLALLAGGRFAHAQRRLRARVPGPELPLVAARYTAWTGDLHAVAAAWEDIRSSAGALLSSDAARDAALIAMTCSELERAATDVGDPAFAAVLHRRSTTAARQEGQLLDSVADPEDDVAAAARLILDFVHGRLGTEPDATRHRLRLRPSLTDESPEIDVASIRFGDGSIGLRGSLARHGAGRRLTWRAVQEAGAIPLTVLLEPVVTGTFAAATVDGHPAELSARPHGQGIIVPVQLVLDDERTLQIDTAG